MYRRSASFGGKPRENILYKKLPLNSAQGLVSAKSEGSIVTKKQLETRKFAYQLPLQVAAAESSTRRKTTVESSDDEDEVIAVRIDSPSKIVFSDDL